MVITREQMATETREKPRNGTGIASFVHYVEGKGAVQKNTNMLAEITLPPGASIGNHPHTVDTEFYIILEGSGVVNDNGKDVPIKTGDTMVTGNGESHSIANTGTGPLRFAAVIVKD